MTTPRCWGLLAYAQKRCQASATHQAVVGCVHEHVFDVYVCDEHLTALGEASVNCVTCFQLPDRHVCLLLGRAKPLEAAGAS